VAAKISRNQTPDPRQTQKQELSCRYYTQNGELFGNGTLVYAEAFDTTSTIYLAMASMRNASRSSGGHGPLGILEAV
jgi:hypothetical protein